MKPDKSGEEIARHLGEALDQLHQDVFRVEVWAGALSAFAQPIPSYDEGSEHLLPPAGTANGTAANTDPAGQQQPSRAAKKGPGDEPNSL